MQPDEANSLSSLACLLIARTKSGEVTGSENSGRSVDETESGRSAAAPKHLIEAMNNGAKAVGSCIYGQAEARYVPHGVTAVLFLAESHIMITTWPEHRMALVDILLCSENMDPYEVWYAIRPSLWPGYSDDRLIERALPPKPNGGGEPKRA